MYIKRYTIAAFVLMGLVGWFVFAYITPEATSFELFGVKTPVLLVAIWVIVPLVVLYLASVFHMAFYSFLGSFRTRKYEKDYDKVLDLIIDAYLGKKNRNHSFKTPPYSLLGKLLDNSTIFPNNNISFNQENEKTKKMSAVLDVINTIRAGEVAELKGYRLDSDNELVTQNNRNRYKKGELKAEDILSNPKKYSLKLAKEAYVDFVQTASLSAIDKYKEFLSREAFDIILARVNADENTLEITNEALMTLIANLDLNKEDYIELSRVAAKNMIPDQRLKLFEMLSNENDDAVDAYLYTLYDLEMVDSANTILEISQSNEYENFKAYSALKECGKQFSIELFV